MWKILIFSALFFSSFSAAFALQGAEGTSVVPVLKDLKLQRSAFPATLSGDCAYIDDKFTMTCSFFISRVAAQKSDKRVNDMLLRMYKDRSMEEWQDHPICAAPEVKDIERHVRVLKFQKKIGKTEEQMIRRQAKPAITFCADPTLDNYKIYLDTLANEVSCNVTTSIERVTMRYDADRQVWNGIFEPDSKQKPLTEYIVKLDSVTGQVGQRLIFMVDQVLRPRGGGKPQKLSYRAKRSDEKYYCGYVDW
ncbi:hypothetical protein SAMN04488071_2177 [Kordiimonas lacus]|uniref:Uncharacterized protein n=1 Tax=Kordiimonas lacus TaxID=637679 RepID=A0A1G7ACU2_9PROT|nr:hypothetical protein SAMN04488071_2177 [Kordiimonas lacus]